MAAQNCEWNPGANIQCFYVTGEPYCTADEAFERICGRPSSCAMPVQAGSMLMPWYPIALVLVLIWAVFFNRMPKARRS